MLAVKHKVDTKLPILEVETDMVVFEQNDVDTTMYFVIEGSVEIYTGDHDNGHKIAVIKKHEFFGDTEMYTHNPRSTSAKVIEKALLVAIKSEAEFEKFVTENRWLSGKIMETMSTRLVVANEALTTKIVGSAVKVELNPDANKEDKHIRRIIRH